jgi:hypothetical protein
MKTVVNADFQDTGRRDAPPGSERRHDYIGSSDVALDDT